MCTLWYKNWWILECLTEAVEKFGQRAINFLPIIYKAAL